MPRPRSGAGRGRGTCSAGFGMRPVDGDPRVRQQSRSVARLAALKAVAQRFSLAVLLLLSIGAMMVGKLDAVLVESLRGQVTDAVAPILDAASRPVAAVSDAVADTRAFLALREENARLTTLVGELRHYQAVAHRLEAENRSLQALFNYHPEQIHAFITARVIADNSGAFVRSLAVNVGTAAGVGDGMAVVGGRGLAGRTVQTGDRSTRVLLLTDLNARIPVSIERTRQRAVLAGDNTHQPKLSYLPPDNDVAAGDRVVTSGHGGLFPPGLPVGVVASIADGLVRIEPFEDLSRLEYVRILDFRPHAHGAAMRGIPGGGP